MSEFWAGYTVGVLTLGAIWLAWIVFDAWQNYKDWYQ